VDLRAVASDRPVILTSSVVPPRPPVEAPPADQRPVPAGSVRIQIFRPEPGMNIARVVDERTGEILSQLPPQQVLNVVEDIVESIRRREVS
jgi:hypothetical protein